MRKLIVTFFWAGLSPVAPGTIGSLAASVLLYVVLLLAKPTWWEWQLVLAIALAVACVFAVSLGTWAVDHFGRKDPQPFVLDEVAGICLTNLLLPVVPNWHFALTPLIALGAFRLFDVTKPPPCRQLEKLPSGWGILSDDLAAAVYANILSQLLCHVLLRVGF